MHYEADKAPDPQEWLELDEQERIDLAIAYHRHYHLPMGQSPKLHGVADTIVESQLRLGTQQQCRRRSPGYCAKVSARTIHPRNRPRSNGHHLRRAQQ